VLLRWCLVNGFLLPHHNARGEPQKAIYGLTDFYGGGVLANPARCYLSLALAFYLPPQEMENVRSNNFPLVMTDRMCVRMYIKKANERAGG
jgi:hypothetical protein